MDWGIQFEGKPAIVFSRALGALESRGYNATSYGTQKSSLAIIAQEGGVVNCIATSMENNYLSGDLSISVSSESIIIMIELQLVITGSAGPCMHDHETNFGLGS